MKRMILGLAGALVLAMAAQAATLNVTRTDDPPPGSCAPGDCSLREAIQDANLTIEADLITVPPGTYLISLVGNDTDDTGDLDVSSDMTISGPATLDGQMLGRIMDIKSDSNVTLQNLRFQNANTSLATNGSLNGGALQISGGRLTLRDVVFTENATQALGGAIYAFDGATTDIQGCTFTANSAGSGAGIFTSSNVTVRNTLFDNNTAIQRGGAMYLQGTTSDSRLEQVTLTQNVSDTGSGGGAILFLGRSLEIDNLLATSNQSPNGNGGVIGVTGTGHVKTVTITNAIFANNSAETAGVVSFVDDDDTLEIANVGMVNNSVTGRGGALNLTGGTINVTNATFSGNQAGQNGGAIRAFGGNLTLRHVTISGGSAANGTSLALDGNAAFLSASLVNTIIDGDCDINSPATITSVGGNLEGPGDTCEFNALTDQPGLSAIGLGILPLRDNPGATPTHELTLVSLARGAGEMATCDAVMVDQLFQIRDSMCNAGAVESNGLFADGFESVPPLGSAVASP